MNNPIGKLMYIGKTAKGDVVNGKTYDCIDLSYGDVRIIDESGEPYWYSATNPAGDKVIDHSVWAVIQDNSSKLELTDFVSGNKSRTDKDIEKERGEILAAMSLEPAVGRKVSKYRKIVRVFVDETPERKKYREEQLESIANFLAWSIQENTSKYNGIQNYLNTFESQPGDQYVYEYNGKKYSIVRNKESWSLYQIDKSKDVFVKRFPLTQFSQANDVKIHIATSCDY